LRVKYVLIEVYSNFLDNVNRNKSTYSTLDFEEVKSLYLSLEKRTISLKNEGLEQSDLKKIETIKKNYSNVLNFL
jgi:hypothetical protein